LPVFDLEAALPLKRGFLMPVIRESPDEKI